MLSDLPTSHIHQKTQRLERFAQWVESQGVTTLEGITPNLVKGFVVELQEHVIGEEEPRASFRGRKLAPLSIAGYVRVVRSFFNWCEREGLLDGNPNPAKKVPRIKIPKYIIPAFTEDQVKAMLSACDTSTHLGFRNHTMVLLFADTGIRVSELAGLKVGDIHETYIVVFGKFSKQREVGISPPTLKALWKYVHRYRNPTISSEQRLFLSASGKPLNPKSLWYILHSICEQAGIEGPKHGPHTLRHTFSKEWLGNGGDIYSLSLVLGHNDVRTTINYLKDFKSAEARAQHIKRSPVENWHLGRKKSKPKKKE